MEPDPNTSHLTLAVASSSSFSPVTYCSSQLNGPLSTRDFFQGEGLSIRLSHIVETRWFAFRCVQLVAPNVSVFFLQPAASASKMVQNWLTSLRETDLFTVPCGLSSLRLCRHKNKVRFGLMSSSSGFRGFAKSTKQLRLDTAQI